MMILVKGKPGSGKSELAESLTLKLMADEYTGRDKPADNAGQTVTAEENNRQASSDEAEIRGQAASVSPLYLATMIPFGEEGAARVKKHRAMREGKGFETLEIPAGLCREEKRLAPYFGGVCLLECVANLAGNEMHATEHAGRRPEEIREIVMEEILWLGRHMKHLVVVTDIFEDIPDADEDTRQYIRLVNEVNRALEEKADRVEGTYENT